MGVAIKTFAEENWDAFCSEFTKREQSTLIYLETCLVDAYGRVEGRRMNGEDMKHIKKFKEMELIKFGRLKMKAIQKLRGDPRGHIYTHWVRFSGTAWKLAHRWRKERSDRILSKHKTKLLRERT